MASYILIGVLVLAIWSSSSDGRPPSSNDGPLEKRQSLTPLFSGPIFKGLVPDPILEASGLGASRQHPGVLYTHNDKGALNLVYAINASTAALMATLTISGATNQDWEDIAVGNCGTEFCIYVGDIGSGGPKTKTVYRLKEPATMTDQTLIVDSTLKFTWGGSGEEDWETLMVDPAGEVYVVSKREDVESVLVHLPSSEWGTGNVAVVSPCATFPAGLFTSKKNPVGGDISPSGTEMLIKFKEKVLYYKLASGETYEQAIARAPNTNLLYTEEPRGESVCWSYNANGYYTASEREEADMEPLYFYRRNIRYVKQECKNLATVI